MDERLNWLVLADKFSMEGDPRGMRACARELFDLDPKSADGPAVMAEAALYSGSREEAESLAEDALFLEANHLRARMVLGGLAAQRQELNEMLRILQKVAAEIRVFLQEMKDWQQERIRTLSDREKETEAQAEALQKQKTAEARCWRYLLFRTLGWMADGFYLAGEPVKAADAVLEASLQVQDREIAAELYSKQLFLRNYRGQSPRRVREEAEKYQSFLDVRPFPQEKAFLSPNKKLRVGYLSPDFRRHAVANFVMPMLRDFDKKNFSVYCYSTGQSDEVTECFRRQQVIWRDMRGREPQQIARRILEDHIDILVDLAGHSQNNSLPVMAMRPAPVQICAIGYTATTGLKAMDYFLSDGCCLPEWEQPEAFTEKILRMERCHLCYVPGVVRQIPESGLRPPAARNGYVTYGCFNNFAKVSDDVLYAWRSVLEQVKDAHLVIKGKLCSIPDGIGIIRDRLQKLSFPMERIELRPYSPDYLEQYRDIDVGLDTMPYTGGLTTCEALYMGVPVITLRGRSHGARFGTSILMNSGLSELVAGSLIDYINKAVRLGLQTERIADYHRKLREQLKQSALMDSRQYMQDLEACYRRAWIRSCEQGADNEIIP